MRKIYSLFIPCILILSLFSGCQKSDNANSNNSPEEEVKRLRAENAELKRRASVPADTPSSSSASDDSKPASASDAIIEIKRLKIYQRSSYTEIDMEVTNASDKFISFMSIKTPVYGANKEYLGSGSTNASNLRPQQSTVIS